jgi:ribosomal protein L11 methyltransferase
MDFATLGIETLSEDEPLVLRAFLPAARMGPELQTALRAAGATLVEPVPIPDVDWVGSFRETFRAFAADDFFVCPAWDPAADEARRQVRGLVVDPGAAFGTGTHETTRLCLSAVDVFLAERPRARVLDLGTGSGILACAASKLGASLVVAVDSDPTATACAARHAALNDTRFFLVCGDLARPLRSRFDLVLANLQASLLVARCAEVAASAVRGGQLVLSGLLDRDVREVESCYARYGATRFRRQGEWASLEVRIP